MTSSEKLTVALKKEMLRRYEAGESKKFIAAALHLSLKVVLKNTPRKLLRDSQIQEIVRLVSDGNKKSDVARQLQVSVQTVRRHTRVKTINDIRITEEDKAEAIRRALIGETTSSIARGLKIGKSSALKIIHNALDKFELSMEQKKVILDARNNGKTATTIASELKLPLIIVCDLLGIQKSSRYSEEQRKSAIRAVESGENTSDVAKKIGTSRSLVSYWFKIAMEQGEAKKPVRNFPKSDDFQFTWITRQDPALEDWRRLIVTWFEAETPPMGLAVDAISGFINKYLIELNLPKKPADLFRRGQILPDLFSVFSSFPERAYKYNKTLYGLAEWVLDSPDFADTEGEETVRLSHLYRNPFNLDARGNNNKVFKSESSKVVIPYYLISDLRKHIAQGPNFVDWKWVHGLSGRETINGQQLAGDWFPITEDQIDRDDPDCVWRIRRRENLNAVLEMWSPVRWVLILIHLQIPTRVGQTRMADSGESDTFIWKNEEFIPNPGLLKQGTVRNPHEQGIFRRPSQHDVAMGAKIYLFFNSNKTADIGKSGKEKGFVCAWPRMDNLDEDPYYWLAKLRDWQMKYNPIDRLTSWCELIGDRKLSPQSKEQLEEYPLTAFLFRTPEYKGVPGPISAHECSNAWQKLMAAYEALLLKNGIEHPSGKPLELINPANGRAWSSPHATRVSLITHLILDGNMPVELMMKIVGHARFIMTVYYTKAGLTRIQDAIKGATEKLDAIKYETFERDLLSTEAERVRDKVVFNSESWKSVLAINPADRNPLGWLHLHDGVCLAGGNAENLSLPGCHNGGPEITAATLSRKARYGPVPGGVRNCCRCRWKCAGKHHLPALAATLNNRAYHLHNASSDAIAAERERNSLMQDKARMESASLPYTRTRELIGAERKHESAMQSMQQFALDVVALNRMIERIMALPDTTDGPTALAAQGDTLSLHALIDETDSELLVLAGVCADVEFFPDLDPGTAVFEFAQLLDQAFEREGEPLIFARLSEKEKMTAANAIMRELERCANRDNVILGRRQVVEIIDRGESLERMLGVNLKNILQLASSNGRKPVSISLVNHTAKNNDDDKQHTP